MSKKKSIASPKSDKYFKRFWDMYIDDVADRENYKKGHLSTLELLCDMLVEYEKLTSIIDLSGYTYDSDGRHGIQVKVRPEVSQLNQCRGHIAVYTKMLGLVLAKDKQNAAGEEKDEWS